MKTLVHLRFRHLQAVARLHETRNVHRAAEQLFLTQSAVSKLLREVEELIGSPLFLRSSQGLRPTEAGDAVAARAHALLAQLNAIETEIGAIGQGAMGRVRLGLTTFSQQLLLIEAITEITERHPRLKISMQTGSHDMLLTALEQGKVDCVITRLAGEAVQGKYAWDVLYEETISVVCRADHPLAGARRISAAALARADWILPPVEAPLRTVIDAYFVEHGLQPPQSILETLSVNILVLMAQRKQVLVPLPTSVAHEVQARQGLVVLGNRPPWKLPPVGLVTRHTDENHRALRLLRQAFLETISASVGGLAAP
ncbi:LysR family transcriptional regulator [Pigmentiphaga sp. YJ18]|uniref:LysR family transcriptional regulator n=1 Tax=Pigmentiphaga sp. YJ18 TaxID=3134907 RepID=UPI00311871C3